MSPRPDETDTRVHLAFADDVATITLDSPNNRNALSQVLVSQLLDALRVSAQTGVGVALLTHTGTTFCAGADLAEALSVGMERGTRDLLELLRAVATAPFPVVAVVRGHVRAGGIGLVGACDMAVVANQSTFAFSEVLLGLAPAVISLTTRTRLTDRDAAYKCLTGVVFDGDEAARSGLVTRAVPAGELDEVVTALVAELRRASPQGLRETKQLLNADLVRRIDDSGESLVEVSSRLFASDQARAAMRAFRAPTQNVGFKSS